MPRLISSLSQTDFSVDSVHLILNVLDCLGKDQLTVLYSVSGDNGTLSETISPITNNIDFEFLTRDTTYACNVTIMEGSSILDSEVIPCRTISKFVLIIGYLI